MTAIAQRRSRRTIVGAAMAVLLVAMASAMFTIGVVTLSNSKEGEAVGVDDRPRVDFPATPNAVLAVTDENGRLASLVVMTLLPDGQGGSIVTVPVNADSTSGFGLQRRPLDASFDGTDVEALVASVEEMLSITVQRAEVVDAAGLAAMLPQTEPVQIVLPNDVIDTQGGGGVIATSGPQTFTLSEMTNLLAAIDDDVAVDVSQADDVAVWEALAQSAPVSVPPEQVPLDDVGRPVAPASVTELVARLWQGDVAVRDLALVPITTSENPTNEDVVLIDRRDSSLVFAQVSPGLVSTPNTGLKVRIVANFTDEQLATTDGAYETSADLLVELIGRLLFLSGNVVSVDSAPTGAPAVTVIEVADERQIQESVDAADAILGQADVVPATTVLEGVDVQITLGMSYLDHELGRGMPADPSPSDSSGTTATTESAEPRSSGSTSPTDVPGTVGSDG